VSPAYFSRMVGSEDLTVGVIAGVIAAGVFIIQFLLPSLLILILIGFLRQEDTAATWCVSTRDLGIIATNYSPGLW
jgi:hypothetical protein